VRCGVAIILSRNIPFCLCPEGNVESLWMRLFPGSKRAVLFVVYRSLSDYHFFDNLTMECEKALSTNCQKLIFLGDFNSDPTLSSQGFCILL